MEPRTSPLPVALLLIAAGGVLYPQLSTRGLAVPVSAQLRVESPATPAGAAERGVDPRELLGDYFGVDRELDAEQRLVLAKAAADRTHTHVRFLTATVPDPVDSRAGWEFDANVDAIQQAVSDSGWLLDRFAFPDIPEPRGGTSSQARLLHERWPGVVLSRDSGDDEPKPVCAQEPMCSELLVTFLVAETPTGGVHQAAFARAIRFVGAWSTEAQTIAVLGPTFSGSSSSLGRAIGALAAELPRGSRFRFVSGSATSRENQRVIQGAAPGVTFRATALPDDVLFPMPIQYLFSKDPDIQHHGLALLAESNTDYAHQLIHGTKSGIAATLLPFPMYVSRLRSEAATSAGQTADQPGTPARFRPLSLQESVTLTDLLPATAPTTTSNYAELRLANILDTVRRQDIRTIGIVATDTRDKLFLAQKLARESPDATLFTVENDLLYAHPQYASYMARGIVASTYPLYTSNQLWTGNRGSQSRRLQFPTAAAEGIYNAALALLDYDEQGNPVTPNMPALVDYAAPGEGCSPFCIPPVWISVVGNGTLWPVKFYPKMHELLTADDTYVFRSRQAASTPSVASVTFPSDAARALYLSITVLALLHIAWCVAIAVRGRRPHARHPAHSDDQGLIMRALAGFVGDAGVRRRSYLLPCLVGLGMVQGFASLLAWLSMAGAGPASIGWPMAVVFAPFAGICVAAMWVAYTSLIVPPLQQMRAWRGSWRTVLRLSIADNPNALALVSTTLAMCALMTWGLGHLVAYASGQIALRLSGDLNPLLLVERAAQLTSGVSTMVPVLLLGAALYLWGAIELRRLFAPAPVLIAGNQIVPVMEQCAAGGVDSFLPRLALLHESIVLMPRSALLPVAIAAAAIFAFAFDPFVHALVTVDDRPFNRFITSFVLLLHLMIAGSLLQLAYNWFTFKHLLTALAAHPLLDAYKRLPKDVMPQTIFPQRPALLDLGVAIPYSDVISRSHLALPSMPGGAATLQEVFDNEVRTARTTHWSASRTWAMLVAAARDTTSQLHEVWLRRATVASVIQSAPAGNEPGSPQVTSDAAWAPAAAAPGAAEGPDIAHKEELVALSVVFVIRDTLARLGDNVLYAASGIFLVFASNMLFPFQARQQLLGFIWIDIVVGLAVILTALFQVDRDEVLSRIASTTPGQITWNRAMIARLAVYGLIPLLTLFAAQFPDIGATILQAVRPIEQSIP